MSLNTGLSLNIRIPIRDVNATTIRQGIVHQIIAHFNFPSTVDGNVIRQNRQSNGVSNKAIIHLRELFCPHGQTIVTCITEKGILHHRVGDTLVEVDTIRGRVHDSCVSHRKVVHLAVKPATTFDVLQPEIVNN